MYKLLNVLIEIMGQAYPELEKQKERDAQKGKNAKVKRIKELAGIAKPHVKSLALKQAKRHPKKL